MSTVVAPRHEPPLYPEPASTPPRKKKLTEVILRTGGVGALSGGAVGVAIGVVLMALVNDTLDAVVRSAVIFGAVGGSLGLLIGLVSWVIDRLFHRS